MSKYCLTGIGLSNKQKTHCVHGHHLVFSNLDLYGVKNGVRICKICKNQRSKRFYHKYVDRFREYDRIHRCERTTLHRQYLKANPNYVKDWNKNNPNKLRKYQQKYDNTHRAARREKDKLFRKNNPNYQKEWRKDNPRSSRDYSIELQVAMNNVRKRDKNTCQWQGCALTHREVPIHVHHIFPRNEYPDLELIEQYMICYCLNHHGQWHRYRGDPVAKLFKNKIITLGVSD